MRRKIRVNKNEVIERTMSGNLLSPKTTKHILKKKPPSANIRLEELR